MRECGEANRSRTIALAALPWLRATSAVTATYIDLSERSVAFPVATNLAREEKQGESR